MSQVLHGSDPTIRHVQALEQELKRERATRAALEARVKQLLAELARRLPSQA